MGKWQLNVKDLKKHNIVLLLLCLILTTNIFGCVPEQSVSSKMIASNLQTSRTEPSDIEQKTRPLMIDESLVIEDFETYCVAEDLEKVWNTIGFKDTLNKTTISLESETAQGNNSLKFHYDNTTKPHYSEAEMVFKSPQDWTKDNLGVLSLSFWGSVQNDPEQMFIVLKDSKGNKARVEYDREPDDIKHEVLWHIWSINLQQFRDGGVDITKIKKLAIGFAEVGPAGRGKVYFDNIRLEPARYVPEYGINADVNNDGLVNAADLAIVKSCTTEKSNKYNCDINKDGTVDSKDIVVVKLQWNDVAIFNKYRPKLLEMAKAGLESTYWRQDQYTTGGIIESDVRVDKGRCLYCPWAWPRCYIAEPLLTVGSFDRAKQYMIFWIACENISGPPWLHCYDVSNYHEYPGIGETDNIGYMLWHFTEYVRATNDIDWLKTNWSGIKYAGDFLVNHRYNSSMKLVWGDEEYDPTQVDPRLPSLDIKYSLHINIVCARGLLEASELAELMSDTTTDNKWRQTAETILTEIPIKLWDNEEKTFMFGLDESGVGLTAPIYWMNLMPFLHFDRFDDKLDDTLDYLKRKLYNKDPKIAKTYWGCDHSAMLDGIVPAKNAFSGLGPFIGALPVYIHCFLKAGRYAEAEKQLIKIFEWSNPENNLIPEHVNTIHPGVNGHTLYPETHSLSYYVDSGNLLHEAFLLTLIARYDPELLIEASMCVESERKSVIKK